MKYPKQHMLHKIVLAGILILLLLAIVTIMPSMSYAEEGNRAETDYRYQYIWSANAYLSISSGIATAKTSISDGNHNATAILCIMYLQKYESGKWTNVASWSKSNNGGSMSFSKTKSVSSGKYRVASRIITYKGLNSETIIIYSPIRTF